MPQPCCSHHISCPGAGNLDFDSPFANLSAEVPDVNTFIGINYGWDANVPPIGLDFLANSCLGVCESQISQADADACAARANLLCINDPIVDPIPSPTPPFTFTKKNPRPLYSNNPETCITTCPDGIGFAYTTAAGKYLSASQILSDRMAMSEACRFAVSAQMCLGSLLAGVCLGSTYSSSITASGGTAPINYTVVNGALPPGLNISIAADQRTMLLQGTPTTGGIYQFTIRAQDAKGIFMQKTYTVTITGIDNASPLPDASAGVAYSVILTAGTMTLPLIWSISAGTLPAGLNLNSASGEIYGTPTSSGTSTFTAQVIDGTGLTCRKVFTLAVTTACWIDPMFLNDSLMPLVGNTGGLAGTNIVSGDKWVYTNRTRTVEVFPTTPDYGCDNGRVYGSFYPVTNRPWYMDLGGAAVQIGPLNGADFVNHFAAANVAWDLIIRNSGPIALGDVYNGSVVVVTLGGAAGFGFVGGSPIGPNGHVLWWSAATSTYHVWSPGSGDVNTGFNDITANTCDVASNGFATLITQIVPAGPNVTMFWNGVSFINVNGVNTNKARANSAGKVAGVNVGGAQFWYWTQGTGLVNIGLPPGMTSGLNVWITDSGIILVNATNGVQSSVWYYFNGVWGPFVNLTPHDPLWTAFLNISAVNPAGYVIGAGTYSGANRPYDCKICSPP